MNKAIPVVNVFVQDLGPTNDAETALTKDAKIRLLHSTLAKNEKLKIRFGDIHGRR